MKFDVPNLLDNKSSISPGQYPFKVVTASEEATKNGEPMMEITISIEHGGERYKLYDHFTQKYIWRLQEFLKAIGREQVLEKGEIAPDDLMGFGRVDVDLEESDEYGPRSKIKRYIPIT